MSSTKRAAASVALELLKKAEKAAGMLGGGEESLHDFRVALRRLVTLMRDFRLAKKDRKRVEAVFDRTGAWRDAEVEAAWLEGYAASHAEGWALQPLVKELAESREQMRGARLAGLKDVFDEEAARLKAKLRKRTGGGARACAELALRAKPVIGRRSRKAVRLLSSVRSEADARRLHKARIAVKRLRYTLEPFTARGVPALRELQTLLGDLNDRDVIAAMLETAAIAGVADPAVLVKAAARAREERHELYRKLRAGWLGPRVKRVAHIV